MYRALAVLLTAAFLAVTAAPDAAHAQRRGGAVAAGLIGGLAAGALLGAAASQAAPAPVYVEQAPRRVYVEPERVYAAPPPPRCYYTRGEPVWDDYRGVWRRSRVQVCD